MQAKELTQTLHSLVESNIATFIWGAPGIGKSSIVKQIARERGIDFIDLRLSLLDPTDLKGIPFYNAKAHQALWAPPAFLPREGEGILFLDELNSAAPAVQASAYQLILDRKVGDYILPEGYAIVAAGNRESDRGVVYKMPAPLANRFVHFELEVSVEDWKEWAYATKIDSRIIAYIGYKNEALFTFDATKHEKSFATPRSWEFVHQILCSNMPEKLLLKSIEGAVGEALAIDFMAFSKVMAHLPDIEGILEGREKSYTDAVDVLYALASGVVSHYLQNPKELYLENLLAYTLKMKPEFAVMIVQDLQRSGVSMEHSENFGAWVEQFAYLLE